MIDKEISVVVQGAIDSLRTTEVLRSVRKHLPNSELILSTWEGSDTDGINADLILLNKDPGMVEVLGSSRNINRQITSTFEGLRHASRTFAIKLRSDCILVDGSILDWADRALQCVRPQASRIFAERIIICRHFTRNPMRSCYLHHPSDIIMFGKTDDLLQFWSSAPVNTGGIVTEQFLWSSCRHRVTGRAVGMNISAVNIWDSEQWLMANFYVVDTDELGIDIPAKTAINEVPGCGVDTCYTNEEWENISQLYSVTPRPWKRALLRTLRQNWYWRKQRLRRYAARILRVILRGKGRPSEQSDSSV
jgi:WavE lipopolysaccharide synthesis